MMIADCIFEMRNMVTRNDGCDIRIKVCGTMSKRVWQAMPWSAPDIAPATIIMRDNGKNSSKPVAKPVTMAWRSDWGNDAPTFTKEGEKKSDLV